MQIRIYVSYHLLREEIENHDNYNKSLKFITMGILDKMAKSSESSLTSFHS